MAKQPPTKTTAATAKNRAIVAIATLRRVGTGAGAAARTPHPSANLGKTMPMVNGADGDPDDLPGAAPVAADNDADDTMMAPAVRVPVKGHTRALPQRAGK